MKHIEKIFTVFLLSVFLLLPSTYAAWQANGTPFCWATANQGTLDISSDGAGNVVLAWWDFRNSNGDIYAQKIDSTGVIKWLPNGVEVCTLGGNQDDPQVLCVGNDTFIVWQDGDIYAQKLDSAGQKQWTSSGVVVCNAANIQDEPQLCSDGAGGIYVVWADERFSIEPEIYAQRLNASGHPQWTTNGVAVCNATDDQNRPRIIPDGSGNALIVWMDTRGVDWDLYAQKINSDGIGQWGNNGTSVSTYTGWQAYHEICSDGSGGVIIVWEDWRISGSDTGIYAQKLDAGGNPQWTVNGMAVCTALNNQRDPDISYDGAGGVVIVWDDSRNGNQDIFAQHLNSNAEAQWGTNGMAVCVASYSQFQPEVCRDSSGNTAVIWTDQRNGTDYDIYGAKIDSTGTLNPSNTSGFPICTANHYQWYPVLCCDGAGGAMVAWTDLRGDGSYADLYIARINLAGDGIPGFALIYLLIGLLALISISFKKKN